MQKQVIVYRYGHRLYRDERVSSHCCLVARAFGAQKIIMQGKEDKTVKESLEKINKKWGETTKIEFSENWKKTLKEHKKKGYYIIHLTMYGMPIQKEEKKLEQKHKIMIVIGSQKVEKEMYETADANISIGNQPHSEIAALAIALDRIFKGKQLEKKFKHAKIQIFPAEKGKIVKQIQ